VNSFVPITQHDQPLFRAWNEGFQAADKLIIVNPYAQTRNPRLAANFTEGFKQGRLVRKMKEAR
jgi:hypothetical protein